MIVKIYDCFLLNFIVLALTFSSLIQLELILLYMVWTRGPTPFFHVEIRFSQHPGGRACPLHRVYRELSIWTKAGGAHRVEVGVLSSQRRAFQQEKEMGEANLEIATFKRENFHSQKAVFKLGQQQRLGTCPPPPLAPSGILLWNDQAQGALHLENRASELQKPHLLSMAYSSAQVSGWGD